MGARVLAALLLWVSIPALAQEAYPSRPVKFVVPFTAGGPLDVMARLVGQKLTEHWGKPVVIENLVGGSGSIGANAVARAAPDGYTLLFTVDIPLTMYPAVAKQVPYNPRTDFRPIAAVGRSDNGLFVNPALGVSTAKELVELAKKQPGKLSFSSAGIAAPAHFAGELFKTIAGIDMVHVPYKGAAPAMTAAMSGEVSMMFGPIPQGVPHVRAGKLKALGVTGPLPSPLLPGVKPLVEQGFPGLLVFNWYGVLAPAKTPDAPAQAVRSALNQAMNDQALRARLSDLGTEPAWDEADTVAKAIAADLMRWGQLARAAKIEVPQ
ncbi:MAG TPA: tripartite tricarboxylate transporter substrate binding protein [Burkholderiales bacterium]|jgi:tripartite-type tricarboxylate transporter receptor subunit TctC|nr:tripartite tricarboxylate transporter substrate binding protein [Burkholderiales bacterium]